MMGDPTKKYQITIKSILLLLIAAIGTFVLLGTLMILALLIVGEPILYDHQLVMIFVLAYIIGLVPTLIIYFDYFFANFNLSMTIDSEFESMIIKKGKREFIFSFEDIIESKLYLPIYRKQDNFLLCTSIPGFGYWHIKTTDGNSFFITSLVMSVFQMIQLTSKSFNHITEKKYMYYYTIKRNKPFVIDEKSIFENNVNRYMIKYNRFDKQELINRINDKDIYQKEAVETCKRLLENENNSNMS